MITLPVWVLCLLGFGAVLLGGVLAIYAMSKSL